MKLEPKELSEIRARHKSEAKIYDAIGDKGWVSHQDRGRLLDHIDSAGPGMRFSGAFGEAIGSAAGMMVAWGLIIWFLHDDLVAAVHWVVVHFAVRP